jgi:uncharacterized membrane protein
MGRVLRRLRAWFFLGILVVVPLGATVLILFWVFERIDNILKPVVIHYWGHYVPGIGFGATVILIFLAGVIASSLAGRTVVRWWESMLRRLPLIRPIYTVIKQVLEGFSGSETPGFIKVVLIEYPRNGMKALSFVTSEFADSTGRTMYNVFIPTSPNIASGFLRIVPADQVTRTDMSVDNAIKLIVSLGRTMPEDIGDKLAGGKGTAPSPDPAGRRLSVDK